MKTKLDSQGTLTQEEQRGTAGRWLRASVYLPGKGNPSIFLEFETFNTVKKLCIEWKNLIHFNFFFFYFFSTCTIWKHSVSLLELFLLLWYISRKGYSSFSRIMITLWIIKQLCLKILVSPLRPLNPIRSQCKIYIWNANVKKWAQILYCNTEIYSKKKTGKIRNMKL